MTYVILFYLISLLSIGGYAFLSLRRDGWRAWAGPSLLAIVTTVSLYSAANSLGGPRPSWVIPGVGDMTVLAIVYDEGNAIYIYGIPKNGKIPMSIQIPWQTEKAKKIRKAERENVPFMFTDSDEEKPVYPLPVPPLPLKDE